jgi:acyl-CoA thioester hydrolase
MPKPDPALLDPARYPFSCSIETRFSDLDINQHLNNVALVGLLEEGRGRFHRAAGNGRIDMRLSPMVVSLAVEFVGQSYFPDPLEMHVGIGLLGRTSYTMYQLVAQRGRVVAFAQAVMVSTADGAPKELPAEFRTKLQDWMLNP